MSAHVLQRTIGAVCEPCIAYYHGMGEYFEGDGETLAHVESAAAEWHALGDVVLSSVEDEPVAHFGNYCNVCGTPPYAGTVYDYTITVFERGGAR